MWVAVRSIKRDISYGRAACVASSLSGWHLGPFTSRRAEGVFGLVKPGKIDPHFKTLLTPRPSSHISASFMFLFFLSPLKLFFNLKT